MMNSGYNHHTKDNFFSFWPSVFCCIQDENYVLIVILKPAVYFLFFVSIGYICVARRRKGLLSPSRFRTTWTKFSGKKKPSCRQRVSVPEFGRLRA
jgi:hypothetical protein